MVRPIGCNSALMNRFAGMHVGFFAPRVFYFAERNSGTTVHLATNFHGDFLERVVEKLPESVWISDAN